MATFARLDLKVRVRGIDVPHRYWLLLGWSDENIIFMAQIPTFSNYLWVILTKGRTLIVQDWLSVCAMARHEPMREWIFFVILHLTEDGFASRASTDFFKRSWEIFPRVTYDTVIFFKNILRNYRLLLKMMCWILQLVCFAAVTVQDVIVSVLLVFN